MALGVRPLRISCELRGELSVRAQGKLWKNREPKYSDLGQKAGSLP